MTSTSVLVSLPHRGQVEIPLGDPHYFYGFAARKFIAALTKAGIDTQVIDYPERFKHPLYGALGELGETGQVHLIFRSTEAIRTIPGCYNIACHAWEFEALKHDGVPDESILLDQVHMLRTCDEIWVPSAFSRDVLARHGVTNVRVVPAPINVPAGDRGSARDSFARLASLVSVPLVSRSSAGEEEFATLANMFSLPLGGREAVHRAIDRRKLFLTICNPYDQRKNLVSLIEGFLMATADDDDAILLIKLVTSGMFAAPAGYLYHQIRAIMGSPHCLNEGKVILFSGHLDEDEMAALYRSANFYVCTSVAEGQNMPLIESMAHGCVPVSVRNTAMADYISTDNAVVIEEDRFSGLLPRLSGYVANTRLTIDFADRYQVADAIGRALVLDDDTRSALVTAAQAAVRDGFDPERIAAEIKGWLETRSAAGAG